MRLLCPAFLALTAALSLNTAARAQNLITNGDFSAGNSGFTSQYTFNGPAQAAYAFSTNPNASFGPAWGNYGDHTTGTGQMLVVNGADNANLNFWAQSVSVAANTNYTFSGWVANATYAPLGTVAFNVNGTSLGSLTTQSTQGIWTRFSAVWNSGNTTTANLSLRDVQTSFDGNDFTVDDLSFVGPAAAAPEPGTLALLLPVMGGVGVFLRRRRK